MNVQDIVFFTNQQKILRFLLEKPNEEFYDRQISILSQVSRAGTNFALRELAKAGIIVKDKKGKMNFYHVSASSALIKELKIVLNIIILSDLLEKTREICIKIILLGSSAKGENANENDMEVLFITNDKAKVYSLIVNDISREKMQPVVATPNDFDKMMTENPFFVKKVNEGKVLWEKA